MRLAASLIVLFAFTAAPLARAHDGHDHGDGKLRTPQYPPAIILPAMDGPKPWSDKPLLDDPDRFQIAIMTDNTGGHRPGIWMKAVERLNLLRPAFVMSVGDLIEGYSSDSAVLEEQWKEFLGFIDKMEMRFFFVAGNHDVSNPMAHDLWRKHFGAEWYSFDYKGVHFAALSSEDTKDQIGPEQLAWLEADLKKHADARWTLLFFHKPLWTISERAATAGNPDHTNWNQVEAALGDRKYTVFAGHVHHYVQYDRRGMKYYHLATTGGGSRMRGVPYGEFDHVTWLTMEKEGPTIINLLLDGMLPPDAITETSIARFRDFLAKTRIEVAPILVDEDEGISAGRIDLRLRNQFDEPIEVTAEIEGLPLRGTTVETTKLHFKAAPGATQEFSVDVKFGETVAFSHFAETLLTAKIRTVGGDQPLSAERTIPVVIDRKYRCPPVAAPVAVDGDVGEWSDLTLSTGAKPLVLGAAETWQGLNDASLRFDTAYDEKFVYFAARITDDMVTSGNGVAAGDQLQLRFDARWISDRKEKPAFAAGVYGLAIAAPKEGADGAVASIPFNGSPQVPPARVATRRTKEGWTVEAAIPAVLFEKSQNENWHSFQFTPILNDVDGEGERPARLIWRGTAAIDKENTNWGQFVRVKVKK